MMHLYVGVSHLCCDPGAVQNCLYHTSQQSLQFTTKIIPNLYTLKFLFQHPSHFLATHDTDSEKMDKNCLAFFPNTYELPHASSIIPSSPFWKETVSFFPTLNPPTCPSDHSLSRTRVPLQSFIPYFSASNSLLTGPFLKNFPKPLPYEKDKKKSTTLKLSSSFESIVNIHIFSSLSSIYSPIALLPHLLYQNCSLNYAISKQPNSHLGTLTAIAFPWKVSPPSPNFSAHWIILSELP